MKPERLRDRIMIWTEEQMRGDILPTKSDIVLKTILYRGELQRSEVAPLLGLSDRAARRITSSLMGIGAFISESTRAPSILPSRQNLQIDGCPVSFQKSKHSAFGGGSFLLHLLEVVQELEARCTWAAAVEIARFGQMQIDRDRSWVTAVYSTRWQPRMQQQRRNCG